MPPDYMAAEAGLLLLLLLLPGKDERKERTAEESYPVAGGRAAEIYIHFVLFC